MSGHSEVVVLRTLIIAGATLAVLIAGVGSGWAEGSSSSETADSGIAGQSCTDGPCRMSLSIVDPPGVCEGQICTLATGQAFTLTVELVSVPATGYILAQSWVEFGSDLIYNPTNAAVDERAWPDCDPIAMFRGVVHDEDTHVSHGCLTSLVQINLASTYVGPFVRMSFKCPTSGSSHEVQLLASGDPPASTNGALFTTAQSTQMIPQVDGLTVICDAAAPIIPTSTAKPATDTPTPTPTLPGSQTPGSAVTDTPTAIANTPGPGEATPTPDASPTPLTPQATDTNSTSTPTMPQSGTAPPASTNTPTTLRDGDASCDGSVDPLDAALILQFAAGLTPALPCPNAADASGDGIVDPLDAALVLQFSAGLIGAL
jgi:hypothetical protein